jgi:hypothetical protein
MACGNNRRCVFEVTRAVTMTIFILKLLAIWIVASVALALLIGPVLRRARREQSIALPPLPSGSLSDRVRQ